jgi:hypothetical protein
MDQLNWIRYYNMFPVGISLEVSLLASQNIGLDDLAVFDTVFENTLIIRLRAQTYRGVLWICEHQFGSYLAERVGGVDRSVLCSARCP